MIRRVIPLVAVLALGAAVFTGSAASADTIAQWTFENGLNPTADCSSNPVSAQGIPYASFAAPVAGSGTISVNGPTPPVCAAPDPYPATGPVGNSWYFGGNASSRGWSVGMFFHVSGLVTETNPAPESPWVQFSSSTSGWQDINVALQVRPTSTSPNTAVFQYTTNGVTWVNAQTITFTSSQASQWVPISVDLSGVPAVNNNPNFAFRLAATQDNGTWEDVSATVRPPDPNSNWRFDNVLITGNTLGANGPEPTITGPDKTTTILGPVQWTVNFDAPVNGFDSAADVTVNPSGSAVAGAVNVIGTNGTAGPYTVTLSDISGTGALSITIPAGVATAVSDAKPNKSSTPGSQVSVIASPLASIGSPSTYFTNGGPVDYTVNFNLPVTGFSDASDILLTTTGTASVGNVAIAGTDGTSGPYTVTLSSITGNGTVAISVAAAAVMAEGIENPESFLSTAFIQVQPANQAVRWDFDSSPSDSDVTTGTLTPAAGSGTALLGGGAGEANPAYATGFPNSGVTADNSGWNVVPFAGVQGDISNTNPLPLSRYIEFSVPTGSFTGLVLSYYQRFSDTAVDTTKLQYSVDGASFVDFATYTASRGSQWFPYVWDLSSITGANNNPNFKIRLLADVNPDTGAYDPSSALSGATLSTNGTWRFDHIRLSGVSSGVPVATLGDLKTMSDGSVVILTGKALYYKQGSAGYIEELDRSSGIRIEGAFASAAGDKVNVTGTLGTSAGGEKYLTVSSVVTTGTAAPGALAANNRDAKTRLMDGIYTTVFGTVKAGSLGDNSFVLTDGSTFDGIGVITNGAPGVSEGEFVSVSGAAGWDYGRVIYKK